MKVKVFFKSAFVRLLVRFSILHIICWPFMFLRLGAESLYPLSKFLLIVTFCVDTVAHSLLSDGCFLVLNGAALPPEGTCKHRVAPWLVLSLVSAGVPRAHSQEIHHTLLFLSHASTWKSCSYEYCPTNFPDIVANSLVLPCSFLFCFNLNTPQVYYLIVL